MGVTGKMLAEVDGYLDYGDGIKKCDVCSYVIQKGEVCVGFNKHDSKNCCKCLIEYYDKNLRINNEE